MITSLDSSVLIDVLSNDPAHGPASLRALRDAASVGALIVCPVVWGEVRAMFEGAPGMVRAFEQAHIQFDPFDRSCADLAGAAWRDYRRLGGSRSRMIADFFIGAHADMRGGRLLTRDRGFYRRYFANVEIIAP
jgi:predicted nucleic acid-binding protein